MANMEFSLSIKDDEVSEVLDSAEKKLNNCLKTLGGTAGAKMESYAKTNRKWTDRTGNARQGLVGSTELTSEYLMADISHQMDYGVFLELSHQKKYAILEESLEQYYPEFEDAIGTLIDTIFG